MEKKSTHGFPVLKWGKATSDQREDFELENPLVVELEEVRLHLHQSRLHLFSTDSLEETLSTKSTLMEQSGLYLRSSFTFLAIAMFM